MPFQFRRPARAAASAGMAMALWVSTAALPRPAGATPSFSFARVAGSDRFDTAKQVALKAFPGGAGTALIATGFNFPDSLAGNFLAGQPSSPVLLVSPAAPVPQATLDALSGLRTKNVIILGLQQAVGADVQAQLAATDSTSAGGGKLNVSRIGGTDRYETMKAIDEASGTTVGVYQGKKTAFLARGDTFPDALGAGPVAASNHFPVILTDPSTLSPQASAVIKDLGIQQLLVLGGPNAVSASVEQAANNAGAATLQRLGGSDRSDTSRLLADYAIAHFGFADTGFSVASGDQRYGGADALASGSFGAVNTVPTLVTNTTVDPGWDVTFASTHSAREAGGYAIGGPLPLPDSTLAPIQAAARGQGTAPAGPFGGGAGSTPPTAANTGPYPNGQPQGVVAPGPNSFTQNGLVYAYSASDQYQLVVSGTCAASSYAIFQSRLSTGDFVGGNYQPTGTSTFCLNDIAPAPPATVTGSPNDGTQPTANTSPGARSGGVTVSFGDSSTPDVTAYDVYRAPATASQVPGGPATCPAPGSPAPGTSPQAAPATPFVLVGTVQDGSPTAAGTETYYYNDTSAGSTTPYCYAVSSVAPDAAGTTQIGSAQTANHDPTGMASQPVTGGVDQPHLVSLVATSSTTLVANYDETINASTCDPVGSLGSDYAITSFGMSQPIQSVSCDNNGAVATGGTIPGLGEAVITMSTPLSVGGGAVMTAQNGPDGNTVCANGSTTNCEAFGDYARALPPQIKGAAQHGSNAVLVNYDWPVTCGPAAASDFTLNGAAGAACTSGPSANQVIVTFAQPFVPGTYSLGYLAPSSPSASTTVHSPTDYAASPQSAAVTIQ